MMYVGFQNLSLSNLDSLVGCLEQLKVVFDGCLMVVYGGLKVICLRWWFDAYLFRKNKNNSQK